MVIRTKIVATLGPATRDPAMLRRLIEAGCDVFRLNFSHGDLAEKAELLAAIRGVEAELGVPVAVMADLCGPKIRVGPLADGQVELIDGATLTIQRDPMVGTAERFSTTLPELIDEVQPGEPVLLDDGKLRLEVLAASPPDAFTCRVVHGGPLRPGKGINLPRTQLTLSALTDKDRDDADWLGERDIDFVALSFVRAAADVRELRGLLRERGSTAHVVAKVEKPQAVEHIEDIVAASDVVMVARGDLGVEMELPAVPVAQKRIARLCQAAGKPCIIATQMLETMTHAPRPTRAEVSDVANAILDHTDAVMLSGETAVGAHPIEAVRTMDEIARVAEAQRPVAIEATERSATGADHTPVVCDMAVVAARRAGARAMVVYTASGRTARLLSKEGTRLPIVAITSSEEVRRRLTILRNVVSYRIPASSSVEEMIASGDAVLRAHGLAGATVVEVSGAAALEGATNTVRIRTLRPAAR